MASQIPLGDLRREYARIRPEIDQAIERVLRRGWFILGEEVEAFEAEVHYPCGVHLQKAYTHLGYEPGSYPNAEEAAAQVLSLPVFPQLSDQEVRQVIRLIRIFLAMR